ncbi:ACP S-malonyltransferase [Geomicrobium sediminis]|uniref:Malonyl CoA-acyl carrier protein transacylase n=1 Tax=Geomicrobium sediminis TaxID=1347788 RepID=A0ABS2PAW1_9BACL|nr:ACP S-malonyltransferase [Geomicrobium sediminis]MBM7632554.1 [acyl-carrier-protein] S-malonyltransferase [Geomicrobium sediminis]
MRKFAFLFPGQGSQVIGMGLDAKQTNESSKNVVDVADRVLQFPLSKLMEEGPEEELKQTSNAQPALVTTSIATLQLVKGLNVTPSFVAGHSLGEYSALVAAGVLTFEDAVAVVRKRGQFMEAAVPNGTGTMAAVMGGTREDLKAVCEAVTAEGEAVQMANVNAPGQVVISGTTAGVKTVGERMKEKGAKRTIPLNVSGPFHSALMEPAANELEQALASIPFRDATVPVITNVSATSEQSGERLKAGLVKQMTSPVLWEDSIRYMIGEGVNTFVEVGSGQVLSGLVRKIDRKNVDVVSIHTKDDVDKLNALLQEV